MASTVYFDCFSGCSGDMVLGALIDAGLPVVDLEKELQKVPLTGYKLIIEKVKRSSIMATKVTVAIDVENDTERHLSDILQIIESSTLSVDVKDKGTTLFRRLGEVEAEIHGKPLESVHFHEVGGVDSIVDILGSLIGFELLGIERFYCSPLTLGSGTVSSSHGTLPVPAPATLKLLAMAHAPISDVPHAPQIELVTPTGAAIVTSLANFNKPDIIVDKVGYGAGAKDFDAWPNVLRLWIGDRADSVNDKGIIVLETNIDDASPEIYGYLMDKLFTRGAVDVWFTPIQMKKNRPATMVSVLAPRSMEADLTEMILRETSTFGVRIRPVYRHIAERDTFMFESSLGEIRVKVKRLKGDILSISPEYEDCRRIALERNIPLQEVYRIVETESWNHLSEGTDKVNN